MNFLKTLLFEQKTTLSSNEINEINNNKRLNLEKYSIKYCQYKYQNSGMLPLLCVDEYLRQLKIEGIERNEPYYNSTFPNINDKILNLTDYEKIINELEQKYTTSAFYLNKDIKIEKKITPLFFNHNEKDYNLSEYEFVVTLSDKN
jgi:hypothetical protein